MLLFIDGVILFSMDVKKRTHEWLLKEYAYYVHHAWYNEYFNNVHQQRQFILAKKLLAKGSRPTLGQTHKGGRGLIVPSGSL